MKRLTFKYQHTVGGYRVCILAARNSVLYFTKWFSHINDAADAAQAWLHDRPGMCAQVRHDFSEVVPMPEVTQ